MLFCESCKLFGVFEVIHLVFLRLGHWVVCSNKLQFLQATKEEISGKREENGIKLKDFLRFCLFFHIY